MIEDLERILSDKCRLDPGLPVLAGVSGGPDSLCLLDLLRRLNYQVLVAHLNHQLRPEANAEAGVVQTNAERAGFDVVVGVADVQAYAKAQSLSVEEAGRIQRYQFLFDRAGQVGAQAVLVGHNADDQAETVLMHITRGSGLAGLRGMRYVSLPNAWSQTIPLVRPLLGVWREEIESYLGERGIKPSIDPSNLDTAYGRNRLRHELIPQLETYNPGVRKALWRLGEVTGEDYALLEEHISSGWDDVLQELGEGYVALHLLKLRGKSLAMQRNILRRAVMFLLGDLINIDYVALDRATAYLSATTSRGECGIKGGVKMFAEGEVLWLVTREAQLPTGDAPQIAPGSVLELNLPGSVALPGGWQLSCEVLEMSQDLRQQVAANADDYRVWIDAGALRNPLHIRTRAPGDRFQPLGMDSGSTKLSDFMINNQLPERLRAGWPLLCAGEDIVWMPGYRVNHRYRVARRSSVVVHLNFKKVMG